MKNRKKANKKIYVYLLLKGDDHNYDPPYSQPSDMDS